MNYFKRLLVGLGWIRACSFDFILFIEIVQDGETEELQSSYLCLRIIGSKVPPTATNRVSDGFCPK